MTLGIRNQIIPLNFYTHRWIFEVELSTANQPEHSINLERCTPTFLSNSHNGLEYLIIILAGTKTKFMESFEVNIRLAEIRVANVHEKNTG